MPYSSAVSKTIVLRRSKTIAIHCLEHLYRVSSCNFHSYPFTHRLDACAQRYPRAITAMNGPAFNRGTTLIRKSVTTNSTSRPNWLSLTQSDGARNRRLYAGWLQSRRLLLSGGYTRHQRRGYLISGAEKSRLTGAWIFQCGFTPVSSLWRKNPSVNYVANRVFYRTELEQLVVLVKTP